MGDVGSNELTGAAAPGMSVIRFQPPDEARGDSIDEDSGWSGEVITDLEDLVRLLT